MIRNLAYSGLEKLPANKTKNSLNVWLIS
jgi:hypothetical protein